MTPAASRVGCSPRIRLGSALWALLAVAAAPSARGQPDEYGWTLSRSATDPYVNTGSLPIGTVQRLYLWLACSDHGWAAAEMRIDEQLPDLWILGIEPRNGVIVVSDVIFPDVRLAVGGCPTGPFLAAALPCLLVAPGAGPVCLVPSSGGKRVTLDCDAPAAEHPMKTIGFGLGLPPGCADEMPLCTPDEIAFGACCLPDGSCLVETAEQCEHLGGAFQGHLSSCATVECRPTGVDVPGTASWGRTKAGYR